MDLQDAATTDESEARNDAVDAQPQQSRTSISSLLFLTFMLFLITGSGSEDISITSRNRYRGTLESLKYRRANYTAWLNGTNSSFTMPPVNPTLSPLVQSLIPTPHRVSGQTSYYRNISGFLNGSSKFYNLSLLHEAHTGASNQSDPTSWHQFAEQFMKHAQINMTEALERSGTYNWNGLNTVTITVMELQRPLLPDILRSTEELNLMHGKIEFINPVESSSLRFQIDGVHFPENGTLLGLATPKGHLSDLRGLPSLVPSHLANATAQAVGLELDRRITKLGNMIDSGSVENDLSSNDDPNSPTCDFTFHFQLKPALLSPYLMEELEAELGNPTGVPTARTPPLMLDGVLISESCGILLETRDAKGLKVQRFWRKATTYAGYAFIVYLGLLILLVRQVESPTTRTPAGLSRVSRWSFIAQAGADAISFIGHLTFGILSDNQASLSLMAPGFLAGVLLIYQAQYAILINQIQGPEDMALRETARQSNPMDQPANPDSELLSTDSGATPQSITAGISFLRAARPRFSVEPQTRFWFLVVTSVIFFFNLIFSPILALFAIGSIYSFLWVPQIVRSARRGARPGLKKDYLFGNTLGRLFLALYIFGCPENVLGNDPSPYVWLILILVVAQVVVILGQDIFGPSFFLPKGWVTVKVYDYHPAIPIPDTEAPKQSLGDCAICMEPIIVHLDSPITSGKATGSQLLSPTVGLRRVYALAPCHHTFHTQCLEQWLAIKNICPQCRRPLPPL